MPEQPDQLSYKKRTSLYNKGFKKLKMKIIFNFLEIFVIFLATASVVFMLSKFLIGGKDFIIPFFIAIIASITITFLTTKIKNYKLTITRFDKEDIYKEVSKNLHEARQ